MIHMKINSGRREFAGERVRPNWVRPGMRVADLRSGPGAMAARLKSVGYDVAAADRSEHDFEAWFPHTEIDFNQPDDATCGCHAFGMITAIEVIEYVESPIGFLRNIVSLLAPGGVAVITTPNVHSVPARVKLLIARKIRATDEISELTHISPIFRLLRRQFPAIAGLQLRQHLLSPQDRFQLSWKPVAWCLHIVATVFHDETTNGDNHIFVLEAGA